MNLAEPTKTLTEAANGSMTDLQWHDAAVAISSVSDVGGDASFNFTPGPTLAVGQSVRITGFIVETNYNNSWLVTATSSGDFEVGTTYTGTEAVGDFEVRTDIVTKLVADDCYKALYEDNIEFIEDSLAPLAVDSVQTTDNTVTTIVSVFGADTADGNYRLDATADGIESGVENGHFIGVAYFAAASGVLTIDTSNSNGLIDVVAWGGLSFTDALDDDLQVQVQGKGAATVDWTAFCDITEL